MRKFVSIQRLAYLKKEMIQFFLFQLSENPQIIKEKYKDLKRSEQNFTYNFKLDIFQKMAIKCIEMGKNILIAAHTSSGKTLIAEYAIAYSLFKGKKVIYTTPIKALSNQKFRDLSRIFSSVGLITGDISINPEGECIVMTTEVLRCILGNRSEEMYSLEWVIIDEAHYIKDLQRGFIWEEILILLPKSVKIICLSATIPNILEFSEWLTNIRKLSFVSIVAQKRPVPLKEYFCLPEIFGLKLFKVNEKNKILKHQKIKSKSEEEKLPSSIDLFFKRFIQNLLNKLYDIKYGPIILFTFSKKKCHEFAKSLWSMNFSDVKSRKVIERFLNKLFIKLPGEKISYSSCETYFRSLKKGIGIHHASLSPFLKEITETLFHANLLFILFATETFSIGLNMPSKTVIFSSLVKFDGKNLRFLNRGEFIQMSGRAGRRGLDRKGIVISILDHKNSSDKIQKVLTGFSEPIGSVFRLSINTFLDFIGPKKSRIKKLINCSYYEFQRKMNTVKKYLLYLILKKRISLLITPKFKFVSQIKNSFQLIESNLDLSFDTENVLDYNKKILIEFVNKKNKYLENQLFNINEMSFSKIKPNLKSDSFNFLVFYPEIIRKKLKFKKYQQKMITNLNFKNLNVVEQVIILGSEVLKIKLGRSLILFNVLLYHFTFFYQIDFLNWKFKIKCTLKNSLKNSCFLDLPKFLNAFLKLRLVRSDMNLSFKGELCSKINYPENLVLMELVYGGIFAILPFPIVITILIGLICEEQYKETLLHPILLSPFEEFQKIILKLYSITRNSSLSIYILRIVQKKKTTAWNLIWAWFSQYQCKTSPSLNLLNNNIFSKYLEYVLKILEITAKLYQCIGNVFLASKVENFWFRLKIIVFQHT